MRVRTADGIQIDHKNIAETLEDNTHLSSRQAEVFVLRRIGDFSVEKTADIMDIGSGTVSGYSDEIRDKISKAETLQEFKKRYT